MSSPPRPGAPLPMLALRLVKGKHSRSDQSYQPIQAALQRMCAAYAVPLTLLADEQVGIIPGLMLGTGLLCGGCRPRRALGWDPVSVIEVELVQGLRATRMCSIAQL